MPPRTLRTSNGRDLTGFYIFTKGGFPQTRKERQDGFWTKEGNSVYITCVGCGTVLNISGHGVQKHHGTRLKGYLVNKEINYGQVQSCTICNKCQNHIFAYLENYDDEDREDDGESYEDEYDDDDYDDDDDEK